MTASTDIQLNLKKTSIKWFWLFTIRLIFWTVMVKETGNKRGKWWVGSVN